MWWNSGTVMVEQRGGTVNSDGRTVLVKQWNSGAVEQCWWNSETVIVEQWNGDGETVWWNSGTVMVEQCGGTVWWKSVVEQ